jgi:hypothetical protein
MTRAYVGIREVEPGVLYVVYTHTTETDPLKYRTASFETYGRRVTVKKTE